MPKVFSINDPQYVKLQYHNTSNLDARIQLHRQFSANQYGWQPWLFDQFKFPCQGCILELGCGLGNLWLENLDRIPAGLEITLSDFSAEMVKKTQINLSNTYPSFQFKVIDAKAIPFNDNSFDIVIANHMLFHVPDKSKALSEIKRVLKSDGHLYASTAGKKHLRELTELIIEFDPRLAGWGDLPSDSFTLENGAVQLGAYFANVLQYRYEDSLVVTEALPLTKYILSRRIELTDQQKSELAAFVERKLKENEGKIFITKDSGVFEASDVTIPV